MTGLITGFLSFLLLVVSSAGPAGSHAPVAQLAGPGTSVPELELHVLELINKSRLENGVSPVALDPAVGAVARAHTKDMAYNQYFSHVNIHGHDPTQRLRAAGLDFTGYGENLGESSNSLSPASGLAALHSSMMSEPTNEANHRHNILDPSYARLGVGIQFAANGTLYLTEDFVGNSN